MADLNRNEHVAVLTVAMQQQKEGLAEARKELRNKLRRAQNSRQALLDVCFILYVWYVPSTALALTFAEHEIRAKGCDVCITTADLEHRYLSTPLGTLTEIASRTGGLPKPTLTRASRFEREFKLFQWIKNHNTLRGLAPNTGMVKQHLAEEREQTVATDRGNTDLVSAPMSKSWVQRFRARWSLSRGRFQQGEQLTTEQINEKARATGKCFRAPHRADSSFAAPRSPDSERGAAWQPPNGGPVWFLVRGGDQVVAPSRGWLARPTSGTVQNNVLFPSR